MENKYIAAAYYFPNYHHDKFNEEIHGKGWNEWELMKKAAPRFEGHQQPKLPLWGFEDEADPAVMAKKIDAAASHHVNTFIFDWYWHNEGPFLDRALDEGFLKAANNDKMNFALMWANHDWIDIHPAIRIRNYPLLRKGAVTKETFEKITDYIIENYFSHPSYLKINGGNYFSVYSLTDLIKSFGSMEETRAAMDEFREKTRARGLGEIHFNAVVWGQTVLPSETIIEDPNEVLDTLGFDSVTSYVWIHHYGMSEFPQSSYAQMREYAIGDIERQKSHYHIPYFPNVSMGWDPSPRTVQSDVYDNLGYPFTPTLKGNTPAEFKKAIEGVKNYLDNSELSPKFFTINAWNEWTEGSYLEPDLVNGYGYLEAIKDVLLKRSY